LFVEVELALTRLLPLKLPFDRFIFVTRFVLISDLLLKVFMFNLWVMVGCITWLPFLSRKPCAGGATSLENDEGIMYYFTTCHLPAYDLIGDA